MSNSYRQIMSELEAAAQHYAGHPLAVLKLRQHADELETEYGAAEVRFALIGLYLGEYAAREVPDQSVRDRFVSGAKATDETGSGHYVKLK